MRIVSSNGGRIPIPFPEIPLDRIFHSEERSTTGTVPGRPEADGGHARRDDAGEGGGQRGLRAGGPGDRRLRDRQVSRRNWAWQPAFHARAGFAAIGGVEVGAKVRVQGIDAGVVETIEPPEIPGGPVFLRLRIDEKLHPLVRTDARARIVPQSLVGAKVVEIVPARPIAVVVADASAIASKRRSSWPTCSRRPGLAKRVNAVAPAAEKGLGEINAIAASIREGKGVWASWSATTRPIRRSSR